MPGIAVDTDVLSFIFKGDTRADLYHPHISGKLAVISFMTLAEMRQWALLRNWGSARRAQLESFLRTFIIFQSDDRLCTKWAEATTSAHRNGHPIDSADAWIAATALLFQVPLIAHNKRHYIGVDGLQIISEGA